MRTQGDWSSMFVEHPRVVLECSDAGLTRQEFADECDVNVLMQRFQRTGIFPQDMRERKYLDLTEVPDFQSAMQMVIDAEAAFMQLPATVRRAFDDNAAEFVKYAVEPENLGQMREWGLAAPEKVPDAPMKVEVVNPASADVKEPASS